MKEEFHSRAEDWKTTGVRVEKETLLSRLCVGAEVPKALTSCKGLGRRLQSQQLQEYHLLTEFNNSRQPGNRKDMSCYFLLFSLKKKKKYEEAFHHHMTPWVKRSTNILSVLTDEPEDWHGLRTAGGYMRSLDFKAKNKTPLNLRRAEML